MTVLEKIKRCVSLVWDFQEIYGEEDIEDFCHNELNTYPQHDEIMEYLKRIENLEKENSHLNQIILGNEEEIAGLQKDCDGYSKTFNRQNDEIVSMRKKMIEAKEIIKKLKALYLYPVVTKDDVKRQDEILAETEQFLNSDVEK